LGQLLLVCPSLCIFTKSKINNQSKIKVVNKNQTIELLKNQLPGFYSVEQVISLIEGIEESEVITTPKLILEGMRELRASLVRAITHELDSLDQRDIVDFYSAEFSLCGNKIHLEDLS